jgi:predicted nuclease with TOPRIM domain
MNYAYRNQDKARKYEPKDNTLKQISDYLSLRERLQSCLQSIKHPIKELMSIGLEAEAKAIEKSCRKSVNALKMELNLLDEKILSTNEQDQELKYKYDLTTSVQCVGFVAASYLLVIHSWIYTV